MKYSKYGGSFADWNFTVQVLITTSVFSIVFWFFVRKNSHTLSFLGLGLCEVIQLGPEKKLKNINFTSSTSVLCVVVQIFVSFR